jgi:hypothetical protein
LVLSQKKTDALRYVDRGSGGTQLDIVCGNLAIGTLWKAVCPRPPFNGVDIRHHRWPARLQAPRQVQLRRLTVFML